MNTLALLAVIATPVGGVLGAILKGIYDRRNTRDHKVVATQTGHTQEMEVAFEGLTANLNSLQEQLKEMRGDVRVAKEDARRTSDDLYTTRTDLRRLESEVADLRVERAAFLIHIGTLESLIPNPPGPPARPIWMIPEAHANRDRNTAREQAE